MSGTLFHKIFISVTCGVTEEGKTITLMYTIPDPLKNIKWDWIHQLSEDGTSIHVAQMIAQASNRGHSSKPIPDDIFKNLESPKRSRADKYFKVTMSRKDNVSIEAYFNK